MSLYKGVSFLTLIIFAVFRVSAQTDSMLQADDLSEVVVTATRSDRKLADVPIPVTIIGQEQIQSAGASRLDEILSEQTGLAIINNHGFGVQMQGIDPEYCLILIDGEPVIGRTAGTLDLTRISLNNVQRIEIIKGPSSSLYGSDALAGVINIITKANKRTGVYAKAQYGSYGTSDYTLSGDLALGKKGVASLSLNRFHTAGYDLTPETYGKTIDPYTDYTFQGTVHYQITQKLKADLSGKYFTEVLKNDYKTTSGKDSILVRGEGKVKDRYISPVFTYRFSPAWKLKLRNYWSEYKTGSNLYDFKADTGYDNTFFHQQMWKEELQSEHILNASQILTLGAGFDHQSIEASRYPAKEFLTDYFLYAQHEWHPVASWNVLTGLRYDNPSNFHSQLSPKIAAQYKLNKHWKVQASVGMGYKSPDFRQMYLTFSNAVAGYSVLGTETALAGLKDMQAAGQISQVYVDLDDLAVGLRPESSVAYNLGGSYTGNSGWKTKVNFFRNDIKDLIDTRVIAMKTNGQPLYSYYNIHRVYTEGMEWNGSVPLLNNHLILSAGYQFLIARDKQVVSDIKKGKVINDPEVGQRYAKMSDYGGLFNRSRHSFNIKAYYTYQTWSVNARMVYRGRYGFVDMNGDDILDADNEYTPGYTLYNMDISKSLMKNKIKIRAGVKNIFDYTDSQHLAYEPGRTWYINASIHLFKTKKSKR